MISERSCVSIRTPGSCVSNEDENASESLLQSTLRYPQLRSMREVEEELTEPAVVSMASETSLNEKAWFPLDRTDQPNSACTLLGSRILQ